jgi:mannose-1-phosphate guanylyltransferase
MHRFLIADQLQDTGLHTANIVLEPVSRNTAPAACVAALMAARSEPGSHRTVLACLLGNLSRWC